MFSRIPGKEPRLPESEVSDIWPDFGGRFELNLFFHKFKSAEGWLGDGYLIIWDIEQITQFQPLIWETFPPIYHFFGSDGGGNQFAFFRNKESVIYISAPNIGSVEDIKVLGSWDAFLDRIEAGDYI